MGTGLYFKSWTASVHGVPPTGGGGGGGTDKPLVDAENSLKLLYRLRVKRSREKLFCRPCQLADPSISDQRRAIVSPVQYREIVDN